MANAQILHAKACSAIDNLAGELHELNFEEYFAHDGHIDNLRKTWIFRSEEVPT